MKLIFKLIWILYFMPLYISALYFTILRIEDINRVNKAFSKDKLPFKKVIALCFAPGLNWLFMFTAIRACFK